MDNIKLTFTGDAFLTKRIVDIYKKGLDGEKYELDDIFSDLKKFFNKSDLVICNLETPLSDNRNEWTNNIYTLTAPKEFAQALSNNGIKFVTTANNHCLDNGIDGIDKTINILDELNIKIFILSYTYGTNAFNNNIYLKTNEEKIKVNMFQNQELSNPIIKKLYTSRFIVFKCIRKILNKLRLFQFHKMPYERTEFSIKNKKRILNEIKNAKQKNVDIIIMCMHEGGQYSKNVLKKTEKTVNFLLKNGVDVVIGNHEHVIHKVSKFDNKFVAYSLGNLTSSFGVIEDPNDYLNDYSILINLYIKKDGDRKIEKITFSILKQVIQETKYGNVVKTKFLNDLIKNESDENEKKKLLRDNKNIVEIVLNKSIEKIESQEEYLIV